MTIIAKLTDSELYKLCQEYGLNARTWKRKFAGLLPEIYRRKLYRKKGFISIYEFAKKVGGMSEFATTRVLNLAKRLEDKPLLKNQLETGSQGWSKIQKVAYIATPETDKEWARKVETLSSRSLEVYVQERRRKSVPGNTLENKESIRQNLVTLSFPLTEKTDHALRVFKRDLEKERKESLSWNEAMDDLLKKKVQKKAQITLEVCPKCADEKGAASRSRHIPEVVKKVVIAKYQDKCGFPGCNKPWIHFHHTRRYAQNMGHIPNSIIPLCKTHHDLMHSGLIGNETLSPSKWYLKKQPDKNSAAYFIDKKVQHHRKNHTHH